MAKISINFADEKLLSKLKQSAKTEGISLSRSLVNLVRVQLQANKEMELYANKMQALICPTRCYVGSVFFSIKKQLKKNFTRRYFNSSYPIKNKILNCLSSLVETYNFPFKNSELIVVCCGMIDIRENYFSYETDGIRKNLLHLVSYDQDLYKKMSKIENTDELWNEVFSHLQKSPYIHSNMNNDEDRRKNDKQDLILELMSTIAPQDRSAHLRFATLFVTAEQLNDRLDFNSVKYFEKNVTPNPNDKYSYWIPLPFRYNNFPLHKGQFYIGVLRQHIPNPIKTRYNIIVEQRKIPIIFVVPIHGEMREIPFSDI